MQAEGLVGVRVEVAGEASVCIHLVLQVRSGEDRREGAAARTTLQREGAHAGGRLGGGHTRRLFRKRRGPLGCSVTVMGKSSSDASSTLSLLKSNRAAGVSPFGEAMLTA